MQHTDITAKAATSTISTPAPTPTIVQPQPTPAPSQTNFSSNNYVGTMVPIAKDGSVFHPHHCLRNGQYRVGEKGAIKTFVDFAEALKYLTEMKTATWLRPNPKGNGKGKGKGTWGGVKAVEWTPLQLETE